MYKAVQSSSHLSWPNNLQFSWNRFCKYQACQHCLMSLESAQAMADRLTNHAVTALPTLPTIDPTRTRVDEIVKIDSLVCL
eukprot:m.83588 g.83588  ORF g.83588 m.83588 type:complete len:81 (-) comp14655_c0_seq38:2128-2370(-)